MTQPTKPEKFQLITEGGLYVKVHPFVSSLKLCAVAQQSKPDPVRIWKRETANKVQIALAFVLKNKVCSPRVVEDQLEVTEVEHDSIDGIDEPTDNSHWFERHNEDASEQFSLKPVVKPTLRIKLSGQTLCLSSTDQDFVRFKESQENM